MLSYFKNAALPPTVPLYIVTDNVEFFYDNISQHEDDFRDSGMRVCFVDMVHLSDLLIERGDTPARVDEERRARMRAIDFVTIDDASERKLLLGGDDGKGGANGVGGLEDNVHMRVKLLKAQLFDLLPERVEYAVYVDSDIVIGHALEPFLRRALHEYLKDELGGGGNADARPNTDTAIALFPDIGVSSAPFHTGVLVASRSNSARLLREWRGKIASGVFRRDQWAIDDTVRSLHLAEHVALLPTDERHFSFLSGDLFASAESVAFLHATLYRLALMDRFGFDNVTAATYYETVMHVPFQYDFLMGEAAIMRKKWLAKNAHKKTPKKKSSRHKHHPRHT